MRIMFGTICLVLSTIIAFASGVSPTPVRERLTSNRTYYVRTDGSNSNTCLVNSAAGACLTLQYVYDLVADKIDLAGYSVTIQIGDGTYAAGLTTNKGFIGGNGISGCSIIGNTGTPGNVVFSAGLLSIGAGSVGNFQCLVRGMRIANAGSNGILLAGANNGVAFDTVEFDTTAVAHILVQHGAFAIATGNYSIIGGAAFHALAQTNSGFANHGVTVTLTGTPAFSSQFVGASFSGYVASATTVYSGAATGQRYNAVLNGVIDSGGGGATFFPGNVAGATASGGQYQ